MKLFKSKKKIEAQKNQQDVEYVSSKLVLVARDFGFSLKDLKVKECGVIPSLRDDSYVFFGLYNKDKTKIKDVVSGKVYACVDGVIQDGDKKYNEYSLNYFKAERAERPNFCMYSYYLKPKKNVCVKTTIFGTMEKYETFYLESIPDVSPNELFGEENVVVTKQTLKTAVAGDLSLCMPKRQLDNIIETLHALDNIAQGTANKDTLLYGVECKYYSARPVTNDNGDIDKFEITGKNNYYAIGDGAGFTRSLGQAAANGLMVAETILNKVQ